MSEQAEKTKPWTEEDMTEVTDMLSEYARTVAEGAGGRSPLQLFKLVVDSQEAALTKSGAPDRLLGLCGAAAMMLLVQMEQHAPGFLEAFKYRDDPVKGPPFIMAVRPNAFVVVDCEGNMVQAVHPAVAMDFAGYLGTVIGDIILEVKAHSVRFSQLIRERAEGEAVDADGVRMVPVTEDDLLKLLGHEHDPNCEHGGQGVRPPAEPPKTGQYL